MFEPGFLVTSSSRGHEQRRLDFVVLDLDLSLRQLALILVETLDVANGEGMVVSLVHRSSQVLQRFERLVPQLSIHLFDLE